MKCVDCGFLALGESEVSYESRFCLRCEESAEQPPLNMLRCTKRMWTVGGFDHHELFETLNAKRRPCEGHFLRDMPGRSPSEHREWEDHKRTRREKIIDRLIGAALSVAGGVGALIGAWLLKHYAPK